MALIDSVPFRVSQTKHLLSVYMLCPSAHMLLYELHHNINAMWGSLHPKMKNRLDTIINKLHEQRAVGKTTDRFTDCPKL